MKFKFSVIHEVFSEIFNDNVSASSYQTLNFLLDQINFMFLKWLADSVVVLSNTHDDLFDTFPVHSLWWLIFVFRAASSFRSDDAKRF